MARRRQGWEEKGRQAGTGVLAFPTLQGPRRKSEELVYSPLELGLHTHYAGVVARRGEDLNS